MSIVLQDIRYNSSTLNYKLIGEATTKEDIVAYKYLDSIISYTCKSFELVGILCAYALKVLYLNKIF